MKRVLVIFAAAWLVGSGSIPDLAAAAPTSSSSLSVRHDRAVYDVLVLDRRLESSKARLTAAQRALATTETSLERSRTEEARADRDLTVSRRRLNERVRETYVRGRLGWLDFLGESRSITALLGRVELLGRVLGQDARLTREVGQARRRATAAAAGLSQARTRQQALIGRIQAEQERLRTARADQAALAARLGERLAAARAAARAAEAKMAEMNRQARASADAAAPARGEDRSSTGVISPGAAARPVTGGSGVTRTGRTLQVRCTAYALPGLTATGVPTGPGIVAVDPRVIPLGTRLYVPGWGEGIAADTGGAIKGAWIDVWLPSEAAAQDWGIRTVTITILD